MLSYLPEKKASITQTAFVELSCNEKRVYDMILKRISRTYDVNLCKETQDKVI